jgi:hypothetical protein
MGVVCPGLVKDAGMWAELDERVPSIIGEVSPERVAKAVLKVIRGSGEELVTAGPVRPIIAAGELSPSLGALLMRRIGFVKLLREAATRHNQGAGRREA